jgi:hypothetical protein
MRNLCFLIALFLISCNKDNDNLKILNKDLDFEIKSFIEKVDSNPPCRSSCVMVEIYKDKIVISNSEPFFRKDYLGSISFSKSKIYFYSSIDFSNYIVLKDDSFGNFSIDSTYSNNCEPSMDRILVIDKKDRNKFHYPPPPNLKNVK